MKKLTPEQRDFIEPLLWRVSVKPHEVDWAINQIKANTEEEPKEPIVSHSCPECGEEEHDFCKGARLIGQAMDLLEDVPEIGCDYMDEGITNAFNELDNEISKWRGWCKEAIDNLGKIE